MQPHSGAKGTTGYTRTANPYRLLYAALGIAEPEEPRTKPPCCDSDGQPPIDPDVVVRFERGLRDLTCGLHAKIRQVGNAAYCQ